MSWSKPKTRAKAETLHGTTRRVGIAALAVAVCVNLCSSCGATYKPAAPHTATSAADRSAVIQPETQPSTLPLTHSADYVIAAGLRWLVVLDVAPILAGIARVAPGLLPPNNVAGFERSLGLELRTLHDVSIAGFDYSTLYVARGLNDVTKTRAKFVDQLAGDPSVSDVGAKPLYTGLFDEQVQHHAILDTDTALWSAGDPTTAKAALLLAQRQLRRSPTALHGAALSLLPAHCKQGSVAVFVPGPISSPPEATPHASTVLGATLALALRATLEGETFAVKLCWRGDWQTGGVVQTKTLLDTVLNSRFTTLLDLTPEERAGTFTQNHDLVEVSYRCHCHVR